jgi:hypothetical protein
MGEMPCGCGCVGLVARTEQHAVALVDVTAEVMEAGHPRVIQVF